MARLLASAALVVVVAAAAGPELTAAAAAPSGLLANFQASPALGLPCCGKATAAPQFSWVVPSAAGAADHFQTSYRIVVTDADDAKTVVWDSAVVMSNQSIAVSYGGPALQPGAAYNWTVLTTTAGALGTAADVSTSDASEPATMVMALESFQQGASYIWSANSKGMFAFLRKVVKRPAAKIVRATAFVTAVTDDYMLCGYKLFLGGRLVGVGPGRGEAVVRRHPRGLCRRAKSVFCAASDPAALPATSR